MIRIQSYMVMCDECGTQFMVTTPYVSEVKMCAKERGWAVGPGKGLKVEILCPHCNLGSMI